MAFDDLPPRPRANFPAAIAYAEDVLTRSLATSRREDISFFADIAYGPDYYQKIDIYCPRENADALPVLLFLHGGAWTGGYKEWMGFMAEGVVRTPAIFVSVSYRLAPEALYPAAVEDTVSAVEWVYRNIRDYGGDPARLFIGGHSAGGHLSALVSYDPLWLSARDLPADIIKGVLPISASFDLRFDPSDPDNVPHIAIRDRFMPSGTDIAAVSPITHMVRGGPPCFASAGSEDFQILIDDAHQCGATLDASGVAQRIEIFEGADHFDASARCVDPGHPWIGIARHFLRTGRLDLREP